MTRYRLCIYFGPQVINIVETKGKLPINNIQIPRAAISKGQLTEEKVPEEVKMVALLKEELIKNKIESKEVAVVLSGKDLIIRSFEIPFLSREELTTALNFEIKKYIPFKLEELISDFQWVLDKSTQKIYVLFMGIKNETIEKYLSVMGKLGLKVSTIEYSAFSTLRLFKLSQVRAKGIIAVVDASLIENDEINFMVVENGFPLFSRDITTIKELPGEADGSEKDRTYAVSEKLRREILISLNYFERKFVGKYPNKIFFIMHPDQKFNLGTFKEVGLEIQFIDLDKINRYIGKPISFSLPFIKAYAGSLSEIDAGIKINLLSAKEKTTPKISVEPSRAASLITIIKPHSKVVIACLLICITIYFFGIFQKLPLKKELVNIRGVRPHVSGVNPDANYAELTNLFSGYREKINTLDSFVKKQLYVTELLDTIARLMPEGMWLENLSFKNKREEDKIELILEGMAYLDDSNREVELVNIFLSKLKGTPLFVEYFSETNITSLDRQQIEKDTMTHFVILCRNYK